MAEEEEERECCARTALPDALAAELERRALDPADCVRLTLVPHQGNDRATESVRPVRIGGRLMWQSERRAGKQVFVRNFEEGAGAAEAVRSLLAAQGAREYHLSAANGDLHVRITRKGHVLESRGKPAATGAASPASHDRDKDLPLSRFDSSALLRVIGVSDGAGAIRASMRGKYDQINSFLRELDSVLYEEAQGGPAGLSFLDCGCGRAYLTLSACCYMRYARGAEVSVCGVDRNGELIGKCREMADALGLAGSATFECQDLADYTPQGEVDVLLSLHACDLATDMAIAAGVRARARHMLVAPCCQHDLQKQLRDGGPSRALLRHSILRERLADILTDAFRAQILRICGYRTRIAEFVSPEATARNIMIRASRGLKPGQPQPVAEYLDMKEEWAVTPALERMLGERLAKLLG